MGVDMRAHSDVAGGIADGLGVFDDRLTLGDVACGDLVSARDGLDRAAFARGQSAFGGDHIVGLGETHGIGVSEGGWGHVLGILVAGAVALLCI